MPGLHLALLDAAQKAGIRLVLGSRLPWLTGRGHHDQQVKDLASAPLVAALLEMHQRLGGDSEILAARVGRRSPTPDLIHEGIGCIIEVDEVQHFTSARALTLDLYPDDVRLGFDVDEYRALIDQWKAKGNAAFKHKTSKDFPGPGGRQAQRAYNDALRDLLAPTFTGHPVIRIPVPARSLDGSVDRLRAALAQVEAQ